MFGFMAILIWAALSLLTHLSGKIPPFQLVAMSFFVGTFVGLGLIFVKGLDPRMREFDFRALLLGVSGLFGYHFFFFMAVRHAPLLEATLINYLWPLLIVLFSVLLPATHQGGRLRWWHLAGAGLGLAGAALVLNADRGGNSQAVGGASHWIGYASALAAAVVWATYSVASRLFSRVPTQAVTLYCFVTTGLAIIAHLMFEQTVWPATNTAWLAVLLLGLGPVGGAFYLWDFAVKQGDIRLLGVLGYFVPLLSLLILVVAGISSPGAMIWLAALLIIAGAVLAASDSLFNNRM